MSIALCINHLISITSGTGMKGIYWRWCIKRLKFSDLFLHLQDTDKFGNDITHLARPLPVEYLIIDVSSCHVVTTTYFCTDHATTYTFQSKSQWCWG